MITLDELKQLAQAAPRGPWQLQIKEVNMDGYFSVRRKIEGMRETVIPDVNEIGPDASAFIAAANPAVVLTLIERLERADGARREAQRQLQEAVDERNGAEVKIQRQIKARYDDLLAALECIADPSQLQSDGDPTALRELAQAAIAQAEKKGGA